MSWSPSPVSVASILAGVLALRLLLLGGLLRRLARFGVWLGFLLSGRGLLLRGLLLGRGLARDQSLLRDLAELQRETLDHRAEPADEAGDRAGDDAGELGVELLASGQAGDRLEGVGVERLPVHQTALVVEQLPFGAQAEEDLGGGRRIALDEGERGRALQVILERLGARLVSGAQRQAVLDDAEACVGVAQARAQLGGLGHADPAVVDREDRLRVLELLRELLHHCCLLFSVHFCVSGRRQRKDPLAGGPE